MKDKKIKLDTVRHMINLKNGQLNSKNGEFKSREKSDYVIRTLNYYYEISEDENIKNKIESILKKIYNCDKTLYAFILTWLAYCITGETNLQKFLLLLGLAGNGNSALLEIMEIVVPMYVSKLDHKTFNERYEKE
jgi:phage/plasmid-associated DNA primase